MITIQIGQAGNQIGAAFWQRAIRVSDHITANPFLNNDGKARCILVDTEPKVLRSLNRFDLKTNEEKKIDLFRESNIFYDDSGRGNNWAFGYRSASTPIVTSSSTITATASQPAWKMLGDDPLPSKRRAPHSSTILEALRKEVERCDIFQGCVLMHSLSGGTGSGLGSRLTEDIRTHFGKHFILSVCVAPFSGGEMPLQHYNSLLSLSFLQEFSDGILLYQNDDVLHALSSHSRSASINATASASATTSAAAAASASSHAKSPPTVRLPTMNAYIANSLMGVMSPIDVLSYYHTNTSKGLYCKTLSIDRSIALKGFDMSDFIVANCPLPTAKFVECYTTAGLTESSSNKAAIELSQWNTISDVLYRSVPRSDRNLKACTAISYQFNVRGDSDSKASFMKEIHSKIDSRFSKALNPVGWNPFPVDYRISTRSTVATTIDTSVNTQTATATPTPTPLARSITLTVNRNRIVPYLSHCLKKCQTMIDAKAYLHWYERYGCGMEVFEEAFRSIQTVIDSYNSLTRK